MIAALALPALALFMVGAVELFALSADKSRLQDAADAAALAAATQMVLAPNESVLERARSNVQSQLTTLHSTLDTPTVEFVYEGATPAGVRVALTSRRLSFFGNLLPPGGFVLNAEATAMRMGTAPLCVLAIGGDKVNALEALSSQVIARSCLVQSNEDINLNVTSNVEGASVLAAGRIKGKTVANAGEGAQVLEDPLASMFAGYSAPACQHTSDFKLDGDDGTLPAGVHCRKVEVREGVLTLAPGVHHFRSGEFRLRDGASLVGDNVTVVVWKDVHLHFDKQVDELSLSGSRGGTGDQARWAGFALAVDPARGGTLKLDFETISNLEGVVYAPGTRLVVPKGVNAAESTPWTVVVAKEFAVEGGRILNINADYGASPVPVPNGVGNKADGSGGGLRLVN